MQSPRHFHSRWCRGVPIPWSSSGSPAFPGKSLASEGVFTSAVTNPAGLGAYHHAVQVWLWEGVHLLKVKVPKQHGPDSLNLQSQHMLTCSYSPVILSRIKGFWYPRRRHWFSVLKTLPTKVPIVLQSCFGHAIAVYICMQRRCSHL